MFVGHASCRVVMRRVLAGVLGLAHSRVGSWACHLSRQPWAGMPCGHAILCQLGWDPAPCTSCQGTVLPKSWRRAGKGSCGSGAAVLTRWGIRWPAPAKD